MSLETATMISTGVLLGLPLGIFIGFSEGIRGEISMGIPIIIPKDIKVGISRDNLGEIAAKIPTKASRKTPTGFHEEVP